MGDAAIAKIDFDARYQVTGHGGVAFYLLGFVTEWTEERWEWDEVGDPDDEDSYHLIEPEAVENRQMVEAVMVGDDHVWKIDVDDLVLIDEDDYCHECGQIGCRGDFRPREDD